MLVRLALRDAFQTRATAGRPATGDERRERTELELWRSAAGCEDTEIGGGDAQGSRFDAIAERTAADHARYDVQARFAPIDDQRREDAAQIRDGIRAPPNESVTSQAGRAPRFIDLTQDEHCMRG